MTCGFLTPCGCITHDGPLDEVDDWGVHQLLTSATRIGQYVRCRRCGSVGNKC